MGALIQTVAPSEEPITTAEAKKHSRVDITADDSYIAALITIARDMVEEETSRRLITQTYQWKLSNWPSRNRLFVPIAPLSSVTSIVYQDLDDASTTFPASSYLVDTSSEPNQIVLRDGIVWPIPAAGLREVNAITITMVMGYGAAAAVPERLKQGIKLLLAHFYENREATAPGAFGMKEIPIGLQRLIQQEARWNQFANARVSQEGG